MKIRTKVLMILNLVFLCSCFSVTTVDSLQGDYSRVDSRIFQDNGYVDVSKKEIVSPGKKWIWYNSWHVVRRQPGFLGKGVSNGPYTIHSSYSVNDFERYTWAHYCYYLFKGEIAEKYSSINYEGKIKNEIRDKRGHVANIIRIDKLDNNLYVITYRRSRGSYRNFYLREVDDYSFFNLPNNKGIAFSDTGIQFLAKVKKYSHGSIFYMEQPVEISMENVVLLNPWYFNNPVELEKVFIPFGFFDKGFIYNHPEIKRRAEEPMMIRIGWRGVMVYFPQGAKIEQF